MCSTPISNGSMPPPLTWLPDSPRLGSEYPIVFNSVPDQDASRLARLVHRLGDLATAAPWCTSATRPEDITSSIVRLVGPKSVLPVPFRDRPLSQWSAQPDTLVCWDIRLLNRMVGGRFPQWLAPVFDGNRGAFDTLSTTWDHAVEDALHELVKPVLPSWKKPPSRKGKLVCDRYFEAGEHVFFVEIKNVRPGEALSAGDTHDLKNWLRSKFFRRDGFPQIDATVGELSRSDELIQRCTRIWPIVLCWTRLPGYPPVTDMLMHLQQERPRKLRKRFQRKMGPPLVIDYHGFLGLVAIIPALAERGRTLGDVFESYFALRGSRPFSIAQHARSMAGPHGIPTAMAAVITTALRSQAALIGQLRDSDTSTVSSGNGDPSNSSGASVLEA